MKKELFFNHPHKISPKLFINLQEVSNQYAKQELLFLTHDFFHCQFLLHALMIIIVKVSENQYSSQKSTKHVYLLIK